METNDRVTYKDDGYRITAYKNGKELGCVFEYKHTDCGHLFKDWLTTHEREVRENVWKFVKLGIDYDRKHNIPAEESINDLYDTALAKLTEAKQ